MTEKLADPIAHHLEFLGYETKSTPDGWHYSEHPKRFNLYYRKFAFGWRLHAAIYFGPSLRGIREPLLEALNAINEKSAAVKFTLNRDADGDFSVRARAYFTGQYRRKDFGTFMDVWHSDLELLSELPTLPDADEEHSDTKEEGKETARVVN